MNRRLVVSVFVTVFVMAGLASPAIAQASTDAVLVMHFDEGSGTIAKDESSYGNDGTIHGATWTTGIFGKALRFDGRDDYIDLSDAVSVRGLTAFTVEAWVKTLGQTSDTRYIYQEDEGITAWARVQFYVQADTERVVLDVRPLDEKSNYGRSAAIGNPLNPNEWYHVVGTWETDGTTITGRIFINGLENAKDSVSANVGSIDNTAPRNGVNHIGGGRIHHGQRGTFFGIIDEVAIYSKALTPEEIKAHYLALASPTHTPTPTPTPTPTEALTTSQVKAKWCNAYADALDPEFWGKKTLTDFEELYESVYQYDVVTSALGKDYVDMAKGVQYLWVSTITFDKASYANLLSELRTHLWVETSGGTSVSDDFRYLAYLYENDETPSKTKLNELLEKLYYYKAKKDDYSYATPGAMRRLTSVIDSAIDFLRAEGADQPEVYGGSAITTPVPSQPGFEALFAIAGLLATVYILRRKK